MHTIYTLLTLGCSIPTNPAKVADSTGIESPCGFTPVSQGTGIHPASQHTTGHVSGLVPGCQPNKHLSSSQSQRGSHHPSSPRHHLPIHDYQSRVSHLLLRYYIHILASNHHLSSQQHDIQQHSTTPRAWKLSKQPHEFRNSLYHQQNRHLASQHHPSPHHITTTLPPSNPTKPALRNPTQNTELGSSVNNALEFRNSLHDLHHHRASDAFQGPLCFAHKPAISPKQTNHVSDTVLGGSNDVIFSSHQPGILSKHHHPSSQTCLPPTHTTTTTPPSSISRRQLSTHPPPTQTKSFETQQTSLTATNSSSDDMHHHTSPPTTTTPVSKISCPVGASDAFQGPHLQHKQRVSKLNKTH